MEEIKNKYFIRLNQNNRIIKTFSTAFEKQVNTDILIGEGLGLQFRTTADILHSDLKKYADIENGLPLTNELGVFQLKYEECLISKISDEELQKELESIPKPQPTKVEILEQENLMLMQLATEQFEKTLSLEAALEEQKQQNLNTMLSVTEIYESNL